MKKNEDLVAENERLKKELAVALDLTHKVKQPKRRFRIFVMMSKLTKMPSLI